MTSVVLLLALGLTWAVPSAPPSEFDYESKDSPGLLSSIEEEEEEEATPSDYPTQDKPQDELAKVQVHYQNGWDHDLHVECAHGHAIYKFQSIHDNHREDRVWRFDCKWVSSLSKLKLWISQLFQFGHNTPVHCNWHNLNDYDMPMLFMCPPNQYMAGVWSHHDNGREDRV